MVKPGDKVSVIECRHCHHVTRVTAIPGDDLGRPFQSFRHVCPKCGENDRYELSDIRDAVAHRKQ